MASNLTSVALKKDDAKRAPKPRRTPKSNAVLDEPFDEAAALESFKDLMLQHGGKHKFEGFVD
jgi:hypothetical protein